MTDKKIDTSPSTNKTCSCPASTSCSQCCTVRTEDRIQAESLTEGFGRQITCLNTTPAQNKLSIGKCGCIVDRMCPHHLTWTREDSSLGETNTFCTCAFISTCPGRTHIHRPILIEIFKTPHSSLGLKPDYYKISNKGRVWSIFTHDFIGGDVLNNGYKKVKVSTKTGGNKNIPTHILVKVTFHGPTPKGYVIDHFDRNKTNNELCNLRFATLSENSLNCDPRVRRSNPILQYDTEMKLVKEWKSAIDVADFLDTSQTSVRRACRSGKEFRGSIWKFDMRDLPGEARSYPSQASVG
jgi:hypothetical protein